MITHPASLVLETARYRCGNVGLSSRCIFGEPQLCIEVSGRQIEQLVDKLILFTNILAADPPRLPLPDPVYRFVSLNRLPRRLELAKVLLGLDSSFDGSMILFQDIVQILDRSTSTAAAEGSIAKFRNEVGRLGISCRSRQPIRSRDASTRAS